GRTTGCVSWVNGYTIPSTHRCSTATVRPSIQPSSRSRCAKAAIRWLAAEYVLPPKNPMVGSFPGCCARADRGQVAATPPNRVMNSRRLIGFVLKADDRPYHNASRKGSSHRSENRLPTSDLGHQATKERCLN